MFNEESRQRLAAFLVGVIGTLFLPLLILHQFGRFAPTEDPSWGGDHHYYFAMAQYPIGARAFVPIENQYLPYAPFSWRVLTPFLAALLPVDKSIAFLTITLAALSLTSFALYLFLRERGFSHALGLVGVGLFVTLYPAAGFVVLDHYLPEPLTFLSIVLALLALEWEKDGLFLVVTCLGVLNKETVLFLLPVFFVFMRRRQRRPKRWLVCFIVSLPILIWLLVRLLIRPTNDYAYLDELLTQFHVRFIRDGLGGLRHQVAQYTFLTWGLIVFLILSPLTRSIRWLARETHLALWLLLAYVQTLFASDTQRLLVYAFPVLIPLALDNLQYVARLLSTPVAVLGVAILIGQIIYFFPWVLGSSLYLVMIWLALLAIVWLWQRHARLD